MIEADELLAVPLFAAASAALRARIASRSAELRVTTGEWVTRQGEAAALFTILEGEVERIRAVAGREYQVTTFDQGEYFGEIPIVIGTETFSDIRALRPSRIMRTEPSDFYYLLTECPEAAEIIEQGLARRARMLGGVFAAADPHQVTIVGNRLDVACHGTRDFLQRNQIVFEWLDPDDAIDAQMLPQAARSIADRPLVVLPGERVLVAPDNRTLAAALGLSIAPRAPRYDIVIAGGGPAGLAAAVYGGSEGLKTLLIEGEAPGGQAGTSSRIENYLGFPAGISGNDLANRALLQARKFETEVVVTRWVRAIVPAESGFMVELDGGERVHTRTVLLATGVSWRKLDAQGADAFVGRGVYYGAARTEAPNVRGRDIFLVGGGNSAGQAAMFFSNYARSVTILIRGDRLEKTMSHYLIAEIATKANVRVEAFTTVEAVKGAARVESIVTRSSKEERSRERPADGVFVFIGADAKSDWLPAEVERDARGFVRTGRDLTAWPLARAPFPLETSVPGIFCAGDLRADSVKRVASGVGEGSIVIAYVHQYLEAAAAG
jgi:thioredoxin reductase (NADPH)